MVLSLERPTRSQGRLCALRPHELTARAALRASGRREKMGVRGRMGGFLEEGPSSPGKDRQDLSKQRGEGEAGRGKGRRGTAGSGGWGGRVGSHGRRGKRVSHGAHRALRRLWRGMGTVAWRREGAGGVLLLKETHPLGSLLVQGPGNGPPYFMGSPQVPSGPKSPEERQLVGTSQPSSGPLTNGFFCMVRPETWVTLCGEGVSPSLWIRSSSSRNKPSCY